MRRLFVAIMMAFALFGTLSAQDTYEGPVLKQKARWKDTDGNFINAHGGGILYYEGTYYWYGENKDGGTSQEPVSRLERVIMGGVNCYSSRDLVTWKFEGVVLKPEPDDLKSDLHPSRVVERPKVIYNEKTRQFVMWIHAESPDYRKACAGVAVSDTPTGPFRYLGSFRPNGAMSRDQTLFVDDDGTAYQLSSSEENQTLHVNRLTPDYLQCDGTFSRVLIGKAREAPAVFKYKGKYYLLSSGCTGWAPNEADLAVADSLLGEWTMLGNPCISEGGEKTYLGQSTYVLPLPDGRLVALFDEWHPRNLSDSRYFWLPIDINPQTDRITIPWTEEWRP